MAKKEKKSSAPKKNPDLTIKNDQISPDLKVNILYDYSYKSL
jgi:hypothetical protein